MEPNWDTVFNTSSKNNSFASFCCPPPPAGLLIFAGSTQEQASPSITWPRGFLPVDGVAVRPPFASTISNWCVWGAPGCLTCLFLKNVPDSNAVAGIRYYDFFRNINASVIKSEPRFPSTNLIQTKKLNCRPHDIWLLHGQLRLGGADEINTLLPESLLGR